jgi:hypothetical protein
MSRLKPVKNYILTENLIDLIEPNEGIILLTRAWVQYGDNIVNAPKKWNTYLMIKNLLNKSDIMKRKVLSNHLRKYLNFKVKEKNNETLFYIPPNGQFGFSKIKRQDIPNLETKLQLESLEALKVVLCQFEISEDEMNTMITKEDIINFIIGNIV